MSSPDPQTASLYASLFEQSVDGVLLARLDGSILRANPAACRALRMSEVDIVRTGREGIVVDDASLRVLLAERDEKGGAAGELRFRRGDGTIFPVELSSTRVLRPGGDPYACTIFRDITERQRTAAALREIEADRDRLRSSLRQASKLEAIGQLAGSVSHDFNNLLTVIVGCAASLKEDGLRGRPVDKEVVEEIAFAAGRARTLTRQLLTFARKQDVSLVSLDVNETVRATEKLLRRLVGAGVELRLMLQPGVWLARFDPGQLEQVVVNLAVNARDAMPAGGTLTIETSNLEAPGGAQQPGGWVRLSVRDTGAGLSPEAREHLFEPFFTTKPRGKGTGLGLATVQGIVIQCGGEISVESGPGQGTAFQVHLPRAPASGSPPPPTVDEATASTGVLDHPATLARAGTAGEALWIPDLVSGVAEIDLQHWELLDWIATLEDAARGGHLAKAEQALRFLERYAAEHFAAEERHMISTGFPGMPGHRALHAAFTAELARRRSEFLAHRSQAALLVGLAEWLYDWLREHVRGADAELALHLRAKGG